MSKNLFRIWTGIAALFAVAVLGREFGPIYSEFTDPWAAFRPTGPDGIYHSPWEHVFWAIAVALGVPLVILVIGCVFAWVVGTKPPGESKAINPGNWERQDRVALIVILLIGALIGTVIGCFASRANYYGGIVFWLQNPSNWWPWSVFGAAIAGLSFYAKRITAN